MHAWRIGHEAEVLREFADLLAIPDVASDSVNIHRNAAALVSMLERRGIHARTLDLPGSPPAVFGEFRPATGVEGQRLNRRLCDHVRGAALGERR